jgi:hypothetical protein
VGFESPSLRQFIFIVLVFILQGHLNFHFFGHYDLYAQLCPSHGQSKGLFFLYENTNSTRKFIGDSAD